MARAPKPPKPKQLPPEQEMTLVAQVAAPALGSARSILTGHPADGLTPDRLAVLLRSAEDGDPESYLELAEQMEERDLHYLSVLGTRKRQVSQLPITVEAASDAAEHQAHAELIREFLARDTLESELFDILDAIGKGFSVTEIIWETAGGRWLPKRLAWRDPRWFEFSPVDGETIQLKGQPSGGAQGLGGGMTRTPVSGFQFKFIQHVHAAKSGLAIRGGFARAVAWCYLFKNYGLKDWVSFCEIYGLPFRIGKYEPGASEDDIRKLMMAVSNVGTDAAAVMPKSMEIDFVDGKSTGAADLYEKLCNYLDRQISKAVLGQTATTDADTGGLGSGKEHGDVRADIERADAKLLAATLQRDLVVPIVQLNFGAQALYPRIKIGREESHDTQAMSSALAQLVPLGLKVGMSTVRDRLGFPDPEPGEEVLGQAADKTRGTGLPGTGAPASGPVLAPKPGIAPSGLLSASYFDFAGRDRVPNLLAAAMAGKLAGEADEIERAAAAIASEQGRAILAPLIEPMLAALARGESFEDAREILNRVAASMDERELEAALEQACLVARAAGNSGL
jgi:phage gp29-like protein